MFAPRAAKARAHDRPIPELAPVTKTILSFKEYMPVSFLFAAGLPNPGARLSKNPA
jgi:hypothetical protein